MSKVEDLKKGTKQPIFVENSGTRVSNQNELQDLTGNHNVNIPKPQDIEDPVGFESEDSKNDAQFVSRYDVGEAQEAAKYDENGLKKDMEAEALTLMDVHMERKKKEMQEFFEKEEEERELKEALGEISEDENGLPVVTEEELTEENEKNDPEPVVDEFEQEMERELQEEMEEKYAQAEAIADDFLAHIEEDDAEMEEELSKTKSVTEIKKNIVENVMAPHPKEEIKLPESISSTIDESDFAELEESETVEDDEDPLNSPEMKELQKSITEKISTVSKKLDLSSFTIAKKPVTISTALKAAESEVKCADWALMSSERCVRMSEFSGSEMEKLIAAASQRRLTLSNVRELYGLLYKHDINPDKPKTLEAWLKTTSFLDSDHLFMAVYAATFGDSNHIPYNCVSDKCKAMWITDNRPIMDMVKFKDNDAKAKFHNILQSAPNYNTNFYKVQVIQISDKYAIGIKVPSIYDVVFEMAALDGEFRNKYSDYITILQYVDEFYLINGSTNSLSPIAYKKYPDNMNKNTKSKIFTYSKILDSLSTDQYTSILAYMREINTMGDEIEYIIPASTCEKCGKEIPESEQSARDLLFTRHQLTALRTI